MLPVRGLGRVDATRTVFHHYGVHLTFVFGLSDDRSCDGFMSLSKKKKNCLTPFCCPKKEKECDDDDLSVEWYNVVTTTTGAKPSFQPGHRVKLVNVCFSNAIPRYQQSYVKNQFLNGCGAADPQHSLHAIIKQIYKNVSVNERSMIHDPSQFSAASTKDVFDGSCLTGLRADKAIRHSRID
jgi:hypothetical protein